MAVGLCSPSHTPLAPVTAALPSQLPVKPLTLPVVAAHCLLRYLVASLFGNAALSSQSDSTGPTACPFLLSLLVID